MSYLSVGKSQSTEQRIANSSRFIRFLAPLTVVASSNRVKTLLEISLLSSFISSCEIRETSLHAIFDPCGIYNVYVREIPRSGDGCNAGMNILNARVAKNSLLLLRLPILDGLFLKTKLSVPGNSVFSCSLM